MSSWTVFVIFIAVLVFRTRSKTRSEAKTVDVPKCERNQLYMQSNGTLSCLVEQTNGAGLCSQVSSCFQSSSSQEEGDDKDLALSAFMDDFAAMKREIKTLSGRLEETMCKAGQWEPWSQCSQTCGLGMQSRRRLSSSLAGRSTCPPENETRSCRLVHCIDCTSQTCKTYVRWGSAKCSEGRERLYTGVAAGSSDTESGSGHNALCLDLNVQFSDDHSDKDENGGRLYGAEYETSGSGVRTLKGPDGSVSCSMCKAATSEVLMIPATHICPASWDVEYKGYLFSNHDSRQKGEYLCVDQNATRYVNGGSQNQLRWHSVEVKCGNLPCPPFVDDRELACVVCSLKSTVQPGSAYVRWGSEACPSSTSSRLVYEGYAAGSSSTSTGGGANPLCLVRQPDWGQHSDIAHSQATIVGAIYGTSGTGLRRLYPLNNRLILCAVCLAENASSTFTLPGSRSCPESYKIEYAGFLFAAYYSHKKSNWVCVEGDEARGAATGQNRKQAVWFPTEVECGGMKCTYDDGDYVKNREVSCSVCSSQSTRMSSTYAAWGRTSCDGGGVVVYRGFAAGGSRGETGNGANLLCMPTQSDYGEHNDKDQDGARLSGYEYKSGVRTNYEVRISMFARFIVVFF